MSNLNTTYALNKTVREEVFEAMCGAVRGAVYWDVRGAVTGAVQGAVFGAANRAVWGAVNGAGVEDSPHPALQDFLLVVRES